MQFVFDYGDRSRTKFRGLKGDCVCRAVTIASGFDYAYVHDALAFMCGQERVGKRQRGQSNASTGVYKKMTRKFIESFGWLWVPTMFIGSGCEVHLREGELPTNLHDRLIVQLSKHLTTVIDGNIHDLFDPSRNGNRCVYGYWFQPKVDFPPANQPY